MSYKPEVPIRVNKSFQFESVKEITSEAVPHIKIRGYASRMLDTEGKAFIDADREHIDTMGIGLSRLKSGNLPLLYAHDQNKPIGRITAAEYKADGLEIEATVYKLPGDDLTNFVYESVKVGTLNSFSVGIIVEEFDMVEKDGVDYLQLAKSEMIETSLVAVPSNSGSTFGILEVKSLDAKKSTYKTLISKDGLKAENPQICEEFGTCVLNTTKALNYEDTKNESWMTSRQFNVYLDVFTETLRDNFDANRWDELSALEVTKNIKEAFLAFIKDQEDLLKGNNPSEINELNEALAQDGSFAFSDNAKSINGEDMHTKDGENPVVDEEVKTEEPVVKTEEPEVKKDEPEVIKEEPKEEAPVKTDSTPEVNKDEPEVVKEDLDTTKEEPVKRTADDFVVETALLGANIDKLELEDMAKYYDAAQALGEIIADFVTSNVKEEAEAQRAS